MHLEILTPEKKLYTGDVYGIQLPGISGSFEILDKHAPMVSALGKGTMKLLLDKSGQNNLRYTIQGGFMEVIQNKVTVLVEGAEERH
jgi:F-type H+-transporting ATPase subunit epsilon